MESGLYEGMVRHRRFAPVSRTFSYRLFMLYLDLSELDMVFGNNRLWSTHRRAVARFRREDHFGDPNMALDEAVRQLVEDEAGFRPAGPIRLLTHLRYFGYCFNPVCFYYCFDESGRELQCVVAEVTNTPWGERHCYVLASPQKVTPQGGRTYHFAKQMHVSPFMEMDLEYRCALGCPGHSIAVHLEDWRGETKILDATLTLRRKEITPTRLFLRLLRFPLMTQKVAVAIHWQALLIWLRRVPFYPHPATEDSGES